MSGQGDAVVPTPFRLRGVERFVETVLDGLFVSFAKFRGAIAVIHPQGRQPATRIVTPTFLQPLDEAGRERSGSRIPPAIRPFAHGAGFIGEHADDGAPKEFLEMLVISIM